MGSAVNQTARQVGGALGIALLVVVILGAPHGALGTLSRLRDLWWYAAVIAGSSGVACGLPRPPASAAQPLDAALGSGARPLPGVAGAPAAGHAGRGGAGVPGLRGALMAEGEPASPPDLENASRFVSASGLRITHTAADRVEGVIDLGPEHHQPWGIVHGGVYASAIESAASIGAVAAAAEHGLVAVGVNNNTNFLRSMTEGRVDVVARPLQRGRTQQLWEVQISDADGRLVALGQVRLQNVVARP